MGRVGVKWAVRQTGLSKLGHLGGSNASSGLKGWPMWGLGLACGMGGRNRPRQQLKCVKSFEGLADGLFCELPVGGSNGAGGSSVPSGVNM